MLYCYTETGVKARVRDRIEKRSKAERGSIYTIYQLKDGGDSLRYRRFSSLDTLSQMGISVEGKNYEEVYSGAFNEGMSLEYLFQKFNIDRPPDFAGYSLSVSE